MKKEGKQEEKGQEVRERKEEIRTREGSRENEEKRR